MRRLGTNADMQARDCISTGSRVAACRYVTCREELSDKNGCEIGRTEPPQGTRSPSPPGDVLATELAMAPLVTLVGKRHESQCRAGRTRLFAAGGAPAAP